MEADMSKMGIQISELFKQPESGMQRTARLMSVVRLHSSLGLFITVPCTSVLIQRRHEDDRSPPNPPR